MPGEVAPSGLREKLEGGIHASEPREGRLGEPSRVARWGMGERTRRHAEARCGSEPHPILAMDRALLPGVSLAFTGFGGRLE